MKELEVASTGSFRKASSSRDPPAPPAPPPAPSIGGRARGASTLQPTGSDSLMRTESMKITATSRMLTANFDIVEKLSHTLKMMPSIMLYTCIDIARSAGIEPFKNFDLEALIASQSVRLRQNISITLQSHAVTSPSGDLSHHQFVAPEAVFQIPDDVVEISSEQLPDHLNYDSSYGKLARETMLEPHLASAFRHQFSGDFRVIRRRYEGTFEKENLSDDLLEEAKKVAPKTPTFSKPAHDTFATTQHANNNNNNVVPTSVSSDDHNPSILGRTPDGSPATSMFTDVESYSHHSAGSYLTNPMQGPAKHIISSSAPARSSAAIEIDVTSPSLPVPPKPNGEPDSDSAPESSSEISAGAGKFGSASNSASDYIGTVEYSSEIRDALLADPELAAANAAKAMGSGDAVQHDPEPAHELVTHRVMSIFDPDFKPNDLHYFPDEASERMTSKQTIPPYPIDRSFKLLVKLHKMHFEFGKLEPFFLTFQIWDIRAQKKISEDFQTVTNLDNDVVEFIGGRQRIPAEILRHYADTPNSTALFSIPKPHPEIYLVIIVEKILQPDNFLRNYEHIAEKISSSQSSNSALSDNSSSSSEGNSHRANHRQKLRDAWQFLGGEKGPIRQPVCWTFSSLFEQEQNSINSDRSNTGTSDHASSKPAGERRSTLFRKKKPTVGTLSEPRTLSREPSRETSLMHADKNCHLVEKRLRNLSHLIRIDLDGKSPPKFTDRIGVTIRDFLKENPTSSSDYFTSFPSSLKKARGYILIELENPRLDNINDVDGIVQKIENIRQAALLSSMEKSLLVSSLLHRSFDATASSPMFLGTFLGNVGYSGIPRMPLPWWTFRNVLYVYPKKINLNKINIRNVNPRNILLKIAFRDEDSFSGNVGAFSSEILCNSSPTILPRFMSSRSKEPHVPARMKYDTSCVTYHQRYPEFPDEIRIDVPVPLRNKFHVLFSIWHVHTSFTDSNRDTADVDSTTTLIGFAMLPLFQKQGQSKHPTVIADGVHALPVFRTLVPGYLKKANIMLKNIRSGEKVSEKLGLEKDEYPEILSRKSDKTEEIFKVETRFVSSIYSQQPQITKFYKDAGSLLNPSNASTPNEVESPTPIPKEKTAQSPGDISSLMNQLALNSVRASLVELRDLDWNPLPQCNGIENMLDMAGSEYSPSSPIPFAAGILNLILALLTKIPLISTKDSSPALKQIVENTTHEALITMFHIVRHLNPRDLAEKVSAIVGAEVDKFPIPNPLKTFVNYLFENPEADAENTLPLYRVLLTEFCTFLQSSLTQKVPPIVGNISLSFWAPTVPDTSRATSKMGMPAQTPDSGTEEQTPSSGIRSALFSARRTTLKRAATRTMSVANKMDKMLSDDALSTGSSSNDTFQDPESSSSPSLGINANTTSCLETSGREVLRNCCWFICKVVSNSYVSSRPGSMTSETESLFVRELSTLSALFARIISTRLLSFGDLCAIPQEVLDITKLPIVDIARENIKLAESINKDFAFLLRDLIGVLRPKNIRKIGAGYVHNLREFSELHFAEASTRPLPEGGCSDLVTEMFDCSRITVALLRNAFLGIMSENPHFWDVEFSNFKSASAGASPNSLISVFIELFLEAFLRLQSNTDQTPPPPAPPVPPPLPPPLSSSENAAPAPAIVVPVPAAPPPQDRDLAAPVLNAWFNIRRLRIEVVRLLRRMLTRADFDRRLQELPKRNAIAIVFFPLLKSVLHDPDEFLDKFTDNTQNENPAAPGAEEHDKNSDSSDQMSGKVSSGCSTEETEFLASLAHLLKNLDVSILFNFLKEPDSTSERFSSVNKQTRVNFVKLITIILLTFTKFRVKVVRKTIKLLCLEMFNRFVDFLRLEIIAEFPLSRRKSKQALATEPHDVDSDLESDDQNDADEPARNEQAVEFFEEHLDVCTLFLARYFEKNRTDRGITYNVFLPTLNLFAHTFITPNSQYLARVRKSAGNFQRWKWMLGALLMHCEFPILSSEKSAQQTSPTQTEEADEEDDCDTPGHSIKLLVEQFPFFSDDRTILSAFEAEEDSESNIVFSDESRKLIKCATLDKLVERVSFDKENDPKFREIFFLTYRSFTTPHELMDKLISRFRQICAHQDKLQNRTSEAKTGDEDAQTLIKMNGKILLRIFAAFKHWIETHFYDFDVPLVIRFLRFLEHDITSSQLGAKSATQLKKSLEKQLIPALRSGMSFVFGVPPPSTLFPSNSVSIMMESFSDIARWPSHEIARQITLVEFELFKNIEPKECLRQAWNKPEKHKRAPNIVKLTERWNNITNWVATMILTISDMPARAAVIDKFVDIAWNCNLLKNFNGVTEIISGIENVSIHRLKGTWALASATTTAHLESLRRLMDQQGANKAMRMELSVSPPPCIPPLSMYLKDLTFIDENSDFLRNDLINFNKRVQISKVILEIKSFQQTPFHFRTVVQLRDMLDRSIALHQMTEDQLWERSIVVEPRKK